MKLMAACIQTKGSPDVADNLARVEPMIREAKKRGAEFIALPENVNMIIADRENFSQRHGMRMKTQPSLS